MTKKYKLTSHERHGMRHSRLYGIWRGIKTRCLNENNKDYKKYGSRGMVDEWLVFYGFLRDMGTSYEAHKVMFGERDTTIERIDNNKGYSKENCRWATRMEQNRNKTYGYQMVPRNRFGRFAKIAELKAEADKL